MGGRTNAVSAAAISEWVISSSVTPATSGVMASSAPGFAGPAIGGGNAWTAAWVSVQEAECPEGASCGARSEGERGGLAKRVESFGAHAFDFCAVGGSWPQAGDETLGCAACARGA